MAITGNNMMAYGLGNVNYDMRLDIDPEDNEQPLRERNINPRRGARRAQYPYYTALVGTAFLVNTMLLVTCTIQESLGNSMSNGRTSFKNISPKSTLAGIEVVVTIALIFVARCRR